MYLCAFYTAVKKTAVHSSLTTSIVKCLVGNPTEVNPCLFQNKQRAVFNMTGDDATNAISLSLSRSRRINCCDDSLLRNHEGIT